NVTGLTATVSLDQVADMLRIAAEGQIQLAGGVIQNNSGVTQYVLGPDAAPSVIEKPDPTGPGGLVGAVLGEGGNVTVSASRQKFNTGNDRENLNGIIDGIIDVSYNGHMAYESRTGVAGPEAEAGTDWYQIEFDREVLFSSLLFAEGHIAWNGINSDPASSQPKGGYFTDLDVWIRQNGVFVPVTSLTLSEDLDPMLFYQQIELMFDPILGDAIRLIGSAGGTDQFTTIVELEPRGVVPEPAGLSLLAIAGLALARRR